MAAICSVPTVRATAAPKVAVRRSNVRAAASGLRTQFGSSVKAFAPLGCVSGRSRHRAKSIRASARSVFLVLSTPRLGRGARAGDAARAGGIGRRARRRERASGRPRAPSRARSDVASGRVARSSAPSARTGPGKIRPLSRAPSQSVFRIGRPPPLAQRAGGVRRAAAPAPRPGARLPRPATGATRAATRTPRARPHRAPNAPRAPRVTSRSRPDRSTSRARDAALVGGARLGGKYQSSARAIPPLLYSPRRLSS